MPTIAVLHNLDRPFLGHVEAPLREAGLELEERNLRKGDPLPDLDAVAGVIVLGSDSSVADGADGAAVFDDQLAFLRAAVERGTPVLGICFGGQLLARALGGSVRHAGRVAGWRELEPTDQAAEDPVFSAMPTPVPALHFNEDVFEPPPGAVEVLVRGGEGAEAFRAGECAWAMQFHPDADTPALDRWWDEYPDWLEAAGADAGALREESHRRAEQQALASQALFGAFARVVVERHGAP